MKIDDDAHPVAMCSGMLLGMAIGLVISAGLPAWRAAADELCKFAATEAGQNAGKQCGSDHWRMRVYP
jgi:hypothetical protein